MYHSLIKNFLIFFITIFFVMLVPSTADAATFQSDYLTFAENEDGTLTVIAYDRSKHESPYNLVVNNYYAFNDIIYQVTAIGDGVFKGHTFYSIHINVGISIGNHAFEDIVVNNYKNSSFGNECVLVSGGDINSDVSIGDYAFANAKFHSAVTFGNFSSIGDYSFYKASFDYLDYYLLQSVRHIGNYAFCDTGISYPVIDTQYICTIGDYAFHNTYVNTFVIWPTLQSIGAHAFQEDYPMVISINSSTKDISHLHLESIIWKQSTFNVHANSPVMDYLKQLRVPFTIIETGEFYIPEALVGEIFTYTSTGSYQDPDTLNYKSYTETTHFKVLDEDSVSIHQCESDLYSIIFSESYTYNNQSFCIESIETNAFQKKHCPELTIVDLSLTKISTIKTSAFLSCSALETVYLPETIKTIEKNAFPNSNKLRIHIPSNITDISHLDIGNLTNVIFVIASDSPLATTLSKMGLTYQPGVSSPIVYPRPAKGTIITEGNLQYKVTGKSTVTLMKCTSKNITRTFISDYILYKDYTFKVTKIHEKAFYKCKKLKTVTIGDNVTQIGDSAFANCSKLKTITFGKNVKKLGKKVLYYDKKLSKIKFKGTKLQSIGKQTFRKVPKKVNIIVPTSKVKKYSKLIKKAK